MRLMCILVCVASTVLAVAAFTMSSAGVFGFILKVLSILIFAFAALVGLAGSADRTEKTTQIFVGTLFVLGFGTVLLIATPRPAIGDGASTGAANNDIPAPKIIIANEPKAGAKGGQPP